MAMAVDLRPSAAGPLGPDPIGADPIVVAPAAALPPPSLSDGGSGHVLHTGDAAPGAVRIPPGARPGARLGPRAAAEPLPDDDRGRVRSPPPVRAILDSPLDAAADGSDGSDPPRRRRRVFVDDRRLTVNREAHSSPLVRIPSRPAVFKRLTRLAKAQGLTSLPGEGSLALATRYMAGGRDGAIGYIRLAASDGDSDAKTWLHVWDDLRPWEQHQVSLDDVCAAAGVSQTKFIKIVAGTAFEANCDVANLVAAVAHPEVVAASVEYAKTPFGIEDRKLLFAHHRFTPTSKGSTINIGVSASAQAAAAASVNPSVPSFSDDVKFVEASKSSVQRQITAGADPGQSFDGLAAADETDDGETPLAPLAADWSNGSD